MILTREKKYQWNSIEKITFRFLLLYISFYSLSIISGSLWEPVIKWIAKSIFNITHDFSANGKGSGDTTYAYIMLFLFFWLSFIGSLVWSVIDRKRASYNQLQYGFLVGIRIILIFFLLTYGIIKVFHLQMPPVSNANMIKTLGEKSPMGLAWTFMGFSKTYSIFAGLAEVIAGLLLIPRRTQTFGAIATIIVMLNVFMMNLCFDIPVKIFSFHLFFMGVIVLMADAKRVFGVLLFNKKLENYEIYPSLKKGDRQIIIIAKSILTIVTIGFFVLTSYPRYSRTYLNSKAPLYGIWEVTAFKKSNKDSLTLETLKKSWKYLAIDIKKYASIKTFNDKQTYVKFEVDTIGKTIKIASRSNKDNADTLHYSLHNNRLELRGKLKKDSIIVTLKLKPKEDFLLHNRGFNWINEYPLNN